MGTNNSSRYFNFPNVILKAGEATAGYLPWDVIITFTTGSNYTYRVVPSVVNGVAPSNFFTLGTGDTSAAKYIKLTISTTAGRVTNVVIASSSTPVVESPSVLQSIPPSSFDIAVGAIGTDGKWYKFLEGKPITVTPYVSFSVDRIPPVPGLTSQIPCYTWAISQ